MKNYTIGLYEKALPPTLSWEEKLRCAKELGYDFLEFSIDESDARLSRLDWTREERQQLLDSMSRTQLPIRSICLSGHRKYPLGSHDLKVREKSLEIMEKAINLADDLGIRVIQLAGYDVYYEQGDRVTVGYFLDNLKRATQMAARKGIVLGFETMETDFMNTVEKAMFYVKQMDNAYLGVYPDCGNLTNASLTCGKSIAEDLQIGAGHLFAMHLKETKPGLFREIPFGTGHVNFPSVIEKAWTLGIRRYVTELWYVNNEDWKEEIRRTIEMIRPILDRQEG